MAIPTTGPQAFQIDSTPIVAEVQAKAALANDYFDLDLSSRPLNFMARRERLSPGQIPAALR
jgi:hypothetical protein